MHTYAQTCTDVKQRVGVPGDSFHHHGTEQVRTKDAEKRNEARSGLRKDAIVTFCLQPPGDARITVWSRTVG